jgi:hypothetical protein
MAITAHSTTDRHADRTHAPTKPDNMRQVARWAGWLYLATFAFSLPTLAMKAPLVHHANFVLGAGSSTPVVWAALFDVLTALAGIGTAVVLFPVVKRRSETAALGFVTSRVLEATMLFVGALSILSVVTLRHDLAGAAGTDNASLVTAGHTLVAVHNWTFLLGPGLMAGINALCLGYVMYRSGLVPRLIPLIGLIGAPLILASAVAVMFGAYTQTSSWSALATVPDFFWELSLGLWMAFKGFKASGVAALSAR